MMIRTGPWTSEQHVTDAGPTRHVRLPGHLGNIIPGGLVQGDSLGAGKPTKPVRVNDEAILLEQRLAGQERRKAAERIETDGTGIAPYGRRGPRKSSEAELRADAAYRLRHLEDIRAKDRARKGTR